MKITEHHCITCGYKSVLTPTLAHLCAPTSQLDEEECFLQKNIKKKRADELPFLSNINLDQKNAM